MNIRNSLFHYSVTCFFLFSALGCRTTKQTSFTPPPGYFAGSKRVLLIDIEFAKTLPKLGLSDTIVNAWQKGAAARALQASDSYGFIPAFPQRRMLSGQEVSVAAQNLIKVPGTIGEESPLVVTRSVEIKPTVNENGTVSVYFDLATERSGPTEYASKVTIKDHYKVLANVGSGEPLIITENGKPVVLATFKVLD